MFYKEIKQYVTKFRSKLKWSATNIFSFLRLEKPAEPATAL